MNVLKSEAKEICLWGEAICSESDYLMICYDGQMIFDIYGFSDDTRLDYETEYKDYEWVLTDINYLKQGNVCKYINDDINWNDICIFDWYNKYNEAYGFWNICYNRPNLINQNIRETDYFYKLCKKVK